MANVAKTNLPKVKNDAELLSYIINATPILREEIDLPTQGESIQPIGQIIVNNERYKNAFLNTINVIGLTVITRNMWEDPWQNFTNKGTIARGQQMREIFVELANIYDYNENIDMVEDFLNNEVPNVFNYIHELNYQKYYKTTTSDDQLAMAFTYEDGLFDLIDAIIGSLNKSYQYDNYIVSKYMLCRRILDGTMTSVEIPDYDTLSPDDIVTFIKGYSNKMTFMKPFYNPAGVRKATPFKDQYLLADADFEASLTTQVLAKSYFKDEASFKTNLALVDGYAEHDIPRLKEILGDAFVEFTEDELNQLKSIPCSIIGIDFFQNRNYSFDNQSDTKKTEFTNPQNLKTNHWLHCWKILSTSPFENSIVFTKNKPSVTSVVITPLTSTLSAGSQLQLNTKVVTKGFANKAVIWEVDSEKASITQSGLLQISSGALAGETINVTATSIFDDTKKSTAVITIA